ARFSQGTGRDERAAAHRRSAPVPRYRAQPPCGPDRGVGAVDRLYQWWFRTRERQVISEPILKDFGTVKEGDAVLAYDKQELLRDEQGRPITRQDPHAVKLHPIT